MWLAVLKKVLEQCSDKLQSVIKAACMLRIATSVWQLREERISSAGGEGPDSENSCNR